MGWSRWIRRSARGPGVAAAAGAALSGATALAVEITILHNFAWHERWTWKDRPAGGQVRRGRLWRFHALNGSVSLAGNLLLMGGLVGTLGLSPIPANLVAVLACAMLNFVASDRVVFRVT
jgi:putative flippase GtrA